MRRSRNSRHWRLIFVHRLPWNLWNDQVEELHRIPGGGDRRGFRGAEIDPHTFGHIVTLVLQIDAALPLHEVDKLVLVAGVRFEFLT